MSNLHDRVCDYLRDSSPVYVEDVPRSAVVEDMMQMLSAAEDALQVAQARVDKIKADLAKIEA